MKSISTWVAIIACTAFVIAVPRDVSGEEAHRLISRVKRGFRRNENIRPPAGLFPNWTPPKKPDRTRWLIFPFPTLPGKSTTRAPTTTKMRTPPTPPHPPIPSSRAKSTTTERPTTVATTQTEKPAVSTTEAPLTTTTEVTTEKPAVSTTETPLTTTTEVTTTEADTTTKKSTISSTTHAPTTTIPRLLKVDNCLQSDNRAQYDIIANTASGPPVLIVRPKALSSRDMRLRKYFAKCQLQLLSVEEWILKTFQAQYTKGDNRCTFSLRTLSPNTEFFVRARMEAIEGVVIPHVVFKWSATNRGFKSGDYVPEKEPTQRTTTSRETKIKTTQRPVTTPTRPTLPPECQDLNRQCRYYAARGSCKTNPEYMENTCKRSCPNLCLNMLRREAAKKDSSVCVDMEKRKCKFWAVSNFCWSSDYGLRALMRDYCRSTCELCKVKKVAFKAGCRDRYKLRCPRWARSGVCERNPKYMYRNCVKSCNKCYF